MSQGPDDGLSDLAKSNNDQKKLTEEQKAKLEIVNRKIEEKNIHSCHDGRHETYLVKNR